MWLSETRVSTTDCILISLLLFAVPIPSFCRQHFKTTHLAARSSSTVQDASAHGVRERRSGGSKRKSSGNSCCPCGAVYRATFTSKWNKATHPNDFPDNLAHFSSVIGGTHGKGHVLWKLGSQVSQTVKKFFELGNTKPLVNEIRKLNYLSVIETKPVYNSRFTKRVKLHVDKARHYISILSKIIPSPDWFVGIDRFDLCNTTSCTWIKNVTINLTPLDAGIDSGLKFRATNSPSKPTELIYRISPNSPNHPDASFFNPSQRSIPPMAQFKAEFLHHKRRCTSRPGAVNCKVSRWSSWTPCSNPCGRGRKERGRVILVHPKNGGRPCPRINRSRHCRGRNCTGKTDCQVKNWSRWTPCAQTCGKSRRFRKREIAVVPRGGGRGCPKLTQRRRCALPPCPRVDCVVSNWTRWSPCSKSCGKGKRKRTRSIRQRASGGGDKCPRLRDGQPCNAFECRGRSRLSSFSG